MLFLGRKLGFWVGSILSEYFLVAQNEGKRECIARGERGMNVGEGRSGNTGRKGVVGGNVVSPTTIYMGILDKLFEKHNIQNHLARDLTQPIRRFGAKTSFNRAFYKPNFVHKK